MVDEGGDVTNIDGNSKDCYVWGAMKRALAIVSVLLIQGFVWTCPLLSHPKMACCGGSECESTMSRCAPEGQRTTLPPSAGGVSGDPSGLASWSPFAFPAVTGIVSPVPGKTASLRDRSPPLFQLKSSFLI